MANGATTSIYESPSFGLIDTNNYIGSWTVGEKLEADNYAITPSLSPTWHIAKRWMLAYKKMFIKIHILNTEVPALAAAEYGA